jgi:hypothetical protein
MVDEAIFALLRAELEQTKAAYHLAKENVWALVAGNRREWPKVPAGLPHPDGSQAISRAVAEENFAQIAYIEAMTRLNRYLLEGTVPEDVLEQLRRKTKSHDGN